MYALDQRRLKAPDCKYNLLTFLNIYRAEALAKQQDGDEICKQAQKRCLSRF